ncbi:hybrid sensor histidine kinase/response regulator [Caulobacter mirabilis]|uniref:histidine kinase n=1 Tax=Caulobacter mirabilis TaxID=69666 RepID=A0A2D2AT82_9CAUL|nr:hybrid sensor histidine kinase/response regulator [Caulobacter mirabilis]
MTIETGDRFGLGGAILTRRQHLPLRMVSCLVQTALLHAVFGWWGMWLWAAAYIGSQLFESWLGPRMMRNPPETAARAANMAVVLFFPSAIVFGGLAMALWVGAGVYGPALGVACIAGAMTNLIVLSRGSRIAFAASATPYGLYLLVMPLTDVGKVSSPLLTAMMIAVGLIMLNIIGAWIATEEARKAQDDATTEAQLRRAEAEAAVEAKSAYVAAISHELRTPISAILAGAAELERTANTAQGKAQARLIGGAGQMMRTLLDDLLDLAKLEVGRMEVEAVAFDLRAATNDVVRMWRVQAREKGLRLRVEGAAKLPSWVQGDPTRLRQVLNNLLSNAIKFTAEGSVTLRIQTEPAQEGVHALSLAVIDTGPGMTPEQVAKLFTPFEQLEAGTARKHGGSGLGLAISRELARLMGGDLVASSAANEGATFTVSLTLPAAEAPAPAETPDVAEARLLVVDDHVVNRQAIALVLAPLGITPQTAASGEEALARLAVEPFDLVLMDVYMPDMDGREATRQLRASAGPNRDIPVIAITASATERDWEACREAGMTGHVAKPIEPAQLYAALEEALADEAERKAAA